MWKSLVVVGFLLLASGAQAQPVVTSDQAFAWDYSDQAIADFSIVRFEISIDTHDDASAVDVGLVPLPGAAESYYTPVPSQTTGAHTWSVRACDAAVCWDWAPPFAYTLAIPEVPSNLRVVPTP